MSRKMYVGAAGQIATMAELAWRGYNVVTPPVDVGDDIFVIRDATGELWRIQVKTSSPNVQKSSISYSFNNVKLSAIETPREPDIVFVFAMRHPVHLWEFLILPRKVLHAYYRDYNVGTRGQISRNARKFIIVLHNDGRVRCSKQDWRDHLNDWSTWST